MAQLFLFKQNEVLRVKNQKKKMLAWVLLINKIFFILMNFNEQGFFHTQKGVGSLGAIYGLGKRGSGRRGGISNVNRVCPGKFRRLVPWKTNWPSSFGPNASFQFKRVFLMFQHSRARLLRPSHALSLLKCERFFFSSEKIYDK